LEDITVFYPAAAKTDPFILNKLTHPAYSGLQDCSWPKGEKQKEVYRYDFEKNVNES